jgi:hypothetical protein
MVGPATLMTPRNLYAPPMRSPIKSDGLVIKGRVGGEQAPPTTLADRRAPHQGECHARTHRDADHRRLVRRRIPRLRPVPSRLAERLLPTIGPDRFRHRRCHRPTHLDAALRRQHPPDRTSSCVPLSAAQKAGLRNGNLETQDASVVASAVRRRLRGPLRRRDGDGRARPGGHA